MERRKDTTYQSSKLPTEYLKMVEGVFLQNFKTRLLSFPGDKKKKTQKETFSAYGEIFPDELLMAVSLKNPVSARMLTCYASVDFPPPSMKLESGKGAQVLNDTKQSVEAVQTCVSSCVDGLASFFQTFFDEDRPVDYDVEYNPEWTKVELDKATVVHVRVTRDNLDLEAQADLILQEAEKAASKKKPEDSGDKLKNKKHLH